jgi:hypothetical protein
MLRLRRHMRAGGRLAASMGAGIGVVALLSAVTGDGASAQARRNGGKGEEVVLARPLGTPVLAVVSLNQQRVTVYDAAGPMLVSPVSSGKPGYDTPVGIYTVLERKVEHYSNLYDDASMPFMQRLTWSGVALHAGVLPGHPASAGCIRLPMDFAERLFGRTKLGMRVIVVRDDISPVAFAHPVLFKPLPAETALAPDAAGKVTRVADATGGGADSPPPARISIKAFVAAKTEAAAAAAKKAEDMRLAARSATLEAGRAGKALRRAEVAKSRTEWQLRQAEQWARGGSERALKAKAAAEEAMAGAQATLDQVKAEVQPKLDLAAKLRDQAKEAAAASKAAQEEAKAAVRKLAPVSVFISRATQRLYVRQSREPLFDMPVTIADPERPLGTFVFTAVNYTKGETDLGWTLVSMYGPKSGPGSASRKGDRRAGPVAADHEGAKAALDRIAIPKEAVERIAELVGPESSLIVSDEGLSRETGSATEFIVLISGEPQGGIRIRRRPGGESRMRYQRYPSSPYGWGSSPFFFW